MRIFGSNIDLRKVDFLSAAKISEHSRFVKKNFEYFFYSQMLSPIKSNFELTQLTIFLICT